MSDHSGSSAAAARLAALDRLTREAAGRVHHGGSGTGAVVASVDGNGRLLEVRVDPAALATARPERVGPEVVAAVAAARTIASEQRSRLVRERLRAG